MLALALDGPDVFVLVIATGGVRDAVERRVRFRLFGRPKGVLDDANDERLEGAVRLGEERSKVAVESDRSAEVGEVDQRIAHWQRPQLKRRHCEIREALEPGERDGRHEPAPITRVEALEGERPQVLPVGPAEERVEVESEPVQTSSRSWSTRK